MKKMQFHIDPADLVGDDAGFVPVPSRFDYKPGDSVYFCLESGTEKLPVRAAARVRAGGKRFGKPRLLKKLLAATGDDWRLEFTKLPEIKKADESDEVNVQPGFSLKSVLDNLQPFDLVVYLPDDAATYGYAGGEHGNVPCEDLANDITWHEGYLAELAETKKACESVGAGGGTGNGGGTIGGDGDDGGFGIGVTLDVDTAEEGSEVCEFIDFSITIAERDLADAKKEYAERCQRPSV